jgi:DNA modification methylase
MKTPKVPGCIVTKRLARHYLWFDISPEAVKIATERLAKIVR